MGVCISNTVPCEDSACPCELNMISLWCGELCVLKGIGHVRGDKKYERLSV